MSRVLTEIDAYGIGVVRMNDRAGKNTFDDAFVAALLRGLDEVAQSPAARVCILEGLPEVWCGGGDREVLEDIVRGQRSPYDLTLTRSLLDVRLPTIAAMAGPAVGGGFVLGMACDVVILAEESRYGVNFMDLGLTPGMGATRLLAEVLGAPLASEMLFGCAYLPGSHFRGRSHVNYVEPRDAVAARARAVAMRMTDKPRAALEMLKHTLAAPKRRAFEEARDLEALMHVATLARAGSVEEALRDNYGTGDDEG